MATRNRPSDGTGQRVDQSFERYDLLLAVVPLPMAIGAAVGTTGSVPPVGGLGLGSFLSLLVVLYGLFVEGPGV